MTSMRRVVATVSGEGDHELERVAQEVIAGSDLVRYVAVSEAGRLVAKLAGERRNASGAESDRYEELLVNPTILDLARRRGDLGCGGLDHVAIRYGAFWQLLLPSPDGHVSVSIEPEGDPFELVAGVREAARPLVGRRDLPPPRSGPELAVEPFLDEDDAAPGWLREAIPSLYAVSDAVRYGAVEAGGRLLLSSRVADPAVASDRSDRYEELLVAPTLLSIAARRGAIDCGGLRFLVVAYGDFFACAFPFPGGHVTISLPRDVDPVALTPAFEELTAAYPARSSASRS
jgi:hypothetical protein